MAPEKPATLPEFPRRKRFQIHLSTAIVMMFVAGGMIWANTTLRTVKYRGFSPKPTDTHALIDVGYGWPMLSVFDEHMEEIDSSGQSRITVPLTQHTLWGPILLSAVLGILAVRYTHHFCEWLIHRRTARKGT